MNRKMMITVAAVLLLGIGAYAVSEQKTPHIEAASAPESASVATDTSE